MNHGIFDPITQPLVGAYAIEASAGTGKTYSITLLWLRLLIEEGLRIDQILVTTFTQAATCELQERLLSSLRRAVIAVRADGHDSPEAQIVARIRPHLGSRNLERELELALSCFDLAPIVTIHGFCQALISRHVLELGCDPDAELLTDPNALIRTVVEDHLLRHASTADPDVQSAYRIGRQVVSNPLGRLLPPLEAREAKRRTTELVEPLKALVGTLGLRKPTEGAILKNLEHPMEFALSEPQERALGPHAARIEQDVARAADLEKAIEVARLHPCAVHVRTHVPKRLQQSSLRTFDDILLTVHRALDEAGSGPLAAAVRTRFSAAIVDECQDSDSVQIDVFQRLFLRQDTPDRLVTQNGIRSFIVIGDPKQSIYRFRGADLSSYQRLSDGVVKAPTMTVNYRSDRPLVEALNHLYRAKPDFSNSTGGRAIRYVQVEAQADTSRIFHSEPPAPVRIQWTTLPDRSAAKRALARQTAREFRQLLDAGVEILDRDGMQRRRMTARDLAVLANDHKDLRLVRQELLAVGIPCQMAGKSLGSIWESDEARDILAWLTALTALESRSDPLTAIMTFAATPLGGVEAPGLLDLRKDPAGQASWSRSIQRDLNDLRTQGPLPLLLRRIADPATITRNLETRDGERRLTNWRHAGVMLQIAWARGRTRPADLERWLARAAADQAEDEGDEDLMKLETDLPAVQLVTIHAAKGLEFPVVSCPFLWNVKSRSFRLRAPIAVLRSPVGTVLDVGSADFVTHLEETLVQEDEEQERLLYVALTRARHRLYLGMAPVEAGKGGHQNGAARSPIAALLGVATEPLESWPGILAPFIQAPAEHAAGGSSPASDGGLVLSAPPPGPGRPWKVQRCASYTSLASAAPDEADAWMRDHEFGSIAAHGDDGLLSGLGGGAALGNQIHAVLENIIGNGVPLEKAVGTRGAVFEHAVRTILASRFLVGDTGTAVRLSDLPSCSIAEMHFLLPVLHINASTLSSALLADPAISDEAEFRDWAEGLARWTISDLQGFLQGYIDLIFVHDNLWYVADYKTNKLPSYGHHALDAAMRDEDYILQAWIYALALHRHLQTHVPGYDFDKHFGGCAYLFVRGFPDNGVWFRRPSLVTIERLAALLEPAGMTP
jgi:exodeoxyribonuclease V beta subunit